VPKLSPGIGSRRRITSNTPNTIFGRSASIETKEGRAAAALNREKARLEAGLSVLLTAGGVIVSTLIDGRTIIVIARVGVISIVRGSIAVAWAVVAIAVIAAAIICARCYSRT
jgi:hypothetical protein